MDLADKSALLKDRLGPAKFKEVADVRRSMWVGGLGGGLVGCALSTLALALRPAATGEAAPPGQSARARAALLRSRQAAIFLMGGAAGSYLGCLFAGTPALRRFSTEWR